MKKDKFVATLEPRLFHACQLRDLELYAKRGRIVSRRVMFGIGDPSQYTPFESDDFDTENGHDYSVFGNLSDGGGAFNNARGMPNVYGPITFEFQASSLNNSGSEEVHIRRTGVYTRDRDGAKKLTTSAEIHQLYVESKGFGRGEFEIPGGTLRLQDAVVVTVAPITINNRHLIDEVRQVLRGLVNCEIVERTGPAYNTDLYRHLLLWAAEVPRHSGTPESLPPKSKSGTTTSQASYERRIIIFDDLLIISSTAPYRAFDAKMGI